MATRILKQAIHLNMKWKTFFVTYWSVVGFFLVTAYITLPNPDGKLENIVIRLLFGVFDTLVSLFVSLFILKSIIPLYIRKKKLTHSILLFLSIIIVCITLRFAIDYYFRQRHFSTQIQEDPFLKARIIISSLIYDNFMLLFFLPLSYSGIRFMADWYNSQNKIQALQNEKAKTELSFLKSQVNPHFLFNTINAIYFTIDEKNENGRQILMNFSEILRYQLYECADDRVSITTEIKYLENYIALQRIRHDNRYDIHFTNTVSVEFQIAPLLLLPFVENAFKHVSNFLDQRNIIDITTQSDGKIFELTVSNTYNQQVITSSNNGIGLKNVKRRLELLYPNDYDLQIKKHDCNIFETRLKLHIY